MVKITILKHSSLHISYEIDYKNYISLIRTYEYINGIIERNDFILITSGNIHKKWRV